MSYFADSLKTLRQQQSLTMQELADKANVSKSMISKIERDEVQPTLDVAARLAKALGTTLSEMLHTTQATQVIFLPKKEQAVWEDAQHTIRRNISPIFEGLKIEWLQVELPASTERMLTCSSLNTPGAEKYILVTKGILEAKVNDRIFQLHPGDSLYFDANCPHEFLNPGTKTVQYYIIIKHG